MRGREFYELAEHLAQGSRPSELRSAVSRAYYGAFHVAREFVDAECRINLPTDASVHKKLQELFDACSPHVLNTIGRRLTSLREARNYADYKLTHLPSSRKANAITHLQIANQLIYAIEVDLANADRALIVDEVRAKASTLFRLTLRT
jgi:uncharacterized protein (UPF0332 family)